MKPSRLQSLFANLFVSQVLVLQVAYNSSGSAETGGSKVLGREAYLVALWAVALCTIVGPVAFSWIAKHFGASIYRGRWGAQA